jgi:hypothetical protein
LDVVGEAKAALEEQRAATCGPLSASWGFVELLLDHIVRMEAEASFWANR